ncbi:UDP-N-acetylglucosamine--undecaprenyl-phosphate N-acetylglucosaminephosphotransferase [Agarivorans sp. MS3-6]|uniref:undecaprenyl-phosphate alpha-N-acetylglucosaminyl 1-phosphate transferase n=1 Tax=Agarivorans sp. TSD2052 TaxID=2937286 RepID=UPI00200BEE31|nr:undecaprenyl-phosphate alpha-N-acetylglucosaminyl 1-phosphate transferase [Agarivorans sp. TSD2052]UPW20043.1 undecaprenyl-phosphate alpha-N-acetylglucosaminyl 1-phosphate transferase [Agarivorans sp. TSD2052]
MTSLIFLLLGTTVLTFVALAFLKPFSEFIGLHDIPDSRKNHDCPVPAVGGIAVFFGLAASTLVFVPFDSDSISYFSGALMCVLLGVIDDRSGLSAKFKLFMQILITLFLCFQMEHFLFNLGDLVGMGDIYLGSASYLLTALAVVGAINAFNMLDGLDGLVGGVAMVTFASMALLFSFNGIGFNTMLALSLSVALIPYLLMNLTVPPFKTKVFLGDAGAMLLGYSVVWLLIGGTQSSTPSFTSATALWMVGLPLMDMASVVIHRVQANESPLKADHRHIHHRLLNAGYSKKQVLAIVCLLALGMACFGVVSCVYKMPEPLLFASFLFAFFLYNAIVGQIKSKSLV